PAHAGEGCLARNKESRYREVLDNDHHSCALRRDAQPSPCSRATKSAKLGPETRAGAVLRSGADFRLWIQSLDLLPLVHQFEGVHLDQADWPRQLSEAVELDVRD